MGKHIRPNGVANLNELRERLAAKGDMMAKELEKNRLPKSPLDTMALPLLCNYNTGRVCAGSGCYVHVTCGGSVRLPQDKGESTLRQHRKVIINN